MTGSSSKTKEIALGDDFGDVAVKANGVRVEIHTDGSVVAYTESDVDAYTNGAVHVHPAVNDVGEPTAKGERKPGNRMPDGSVDAYTAGAVKAHAAANDESKSASLAGFTRLEPGVRMRDGTIYAGISPDTHKPMYATPADAPLTMKWKQAMEYAAKLDAHGHHDWRAPTKGELNVLFQNRAAIGGFNDIYDSGPAGWYWSSLEDYFIGAWAQQFNDGHQFVDARYYASSLRCVRG